MTTIDALLEEYRLQARLAGQAAADVEKYDELRRIVFSEQVLAAGDIATSKAEHVARASKAYESACASLVVARNTAAAAKAEADYLSMRFEKWRSSMASARAAQQRGER